MRLTVWQRLKNLWKLSESTEISVSADYTDSPYYTVIEKAQIIYPNKKNEVGKLKPNASLDDLLQ